MADLDITAWEETEDDQTNTQQWEDTWADDDEAEDFAIQLQYVLESVIGLISAKCKFLDSTTALNYARSETSKRSGVQPMKM